EMAIMMRDLLEPLVGDAPAPGHIAQERDDLVLPLGASETGQQDRVVGDGLGDERIASGRYGRGVRNGIRVSGGHTRHPPTSGYEPARNRTDCAREPYASGGTWRRLSWLSSAPAAPTRD